MAYVLQQTHDLAEQIQNQGENPIHVIITGDHNSKPESALLKMVLDGKPTDEEHLSHELTFEPEHLKTKWLDQRKSQIDIYSHIFKQVEPIFQSEFLKVKSAYSGYYDKEFDFKDGLK